MNTSGIVNEIQSSNSEVAAGMRRRISSALTSTERPWLGQSQPKPVTCLLARADYSGGDRHGPPQSLLLEFSTGFRRMEEHHKLRRVSTNRVTETR